MAKKKTPLFSFGKKRRLNTNHLWGVFEFVGWPQPRLTYGQRCIKTGKQAWQKFRSRLPMGGAC